MFELVRWLVDQRQTAGMTPSNNYGSGFIAAFDASMLLAAGAPELVAHPTADLRRMPFEVPLLQPRAACGAGMDAARSRYAADAHAVFAADGVDAEMHDLPCVNVPYRTMLKAVMNDPQLGAPWRDLFRRPRGTAAAP
jgi:hypothetical protein